MRDKRAAVANPESGSPGPIDLAAQPSRPRRPESVPLASAHLLRSAYSLAANTAVTAGLGVGFWILAARLFPSTSVGRDTVLISVMIELSTLCQLNLANAIVRFLPDLGASSPRMLVGAYGAAAAFAALAGICFVVLAPRAVSQLAFLGKSPALQVTFVGTLILWGIFALQDAALTALRRAPWVLVENGLFGALKLTALPLMLVAGIDNGIFAAWALPMALLVIPVNFMIFRRVLPSVRAQSGAEPALVRFGRRRAVGFLAQDYLASVFTQATLTMLPLLVISLLGARQSAYFAIPFMIAIAFDTLAASTCTALVVESTLEAEHLQSLLRLYVRRVLTPLIPVGLALIASAPLILRLFGAAYAENGTTVLRLLLCASLLRVGTVLFSALSRIGGHGLRIGIVEFALLTLSLSLASALARSNGIDGVGLAWLIANAIVLLSVLPTLRCALLRR